MRRPDLSIVQILKWVDAFHSATGRWPHKKSGQIPGSFGETWMAVAMALQNRGRGLSIEGSSLARLLAQERSVRHRLESPRLTREQVKTWALAHWERTGMWPSDLTGAIAEAPGETWRCVDKALRSGRRGLSGKSSLAQVLAECHTLGVHRRRPPLRLRQILEWADAHHSRTGNWPTRQSGQIAEASETSWMMVHMALLSGKRGLSGGSSLSKLLRQYRGVRPIRRASLSVEQILEWAQSYRSRCGRCPVITSGEIPEADALTWTAVDLALRNGLRGLPGGTTLSRILREYPVVANSAVIELTLQR